MNTATLILIILGLANEPVIVPIPQKSLDDCWIERRREDKAPRIPGLIIDSYCVPRPIPFDKTPQPIKRA